MLGVLAHSALDYTYSYNNVPTTTTLDSATTASLMAFFGVTMLISLVAAVFLIVCMWRIYTKAGKPGWASIIPFYNIWVLAEIAGKPGWWLFLFFIPFVNIVASVLLALGLARNFGKSEVFGLLALWLFSPIGYIVLAFGSATYGGAAPAPAAPSQPVTPVPVQ